MNHKKVGTIFALLLVFAFVTAFTGCEKLNVSKLRANYHFNKANQFFKDGKFRRAMQEYENTLNYNSNLIQAYRFLGESYKSLYKIGVDTPENNDVAAKALDSFKKAYDAEPTNKEIIFSLGDMYDKLKDFRTPRSSTSGSSSSSPATWATTTSWPNFTSATPSKKPSCGPRPSRCTCAGSSSIR
jgi:tetratricopeptide (TPR) repeat protein